MRAQRQYLEQIQRLRQRPPAEALEPLLAHLSGHGSAAAEASIRALGALGHPAAVAPLTSLYESLDADGPGRDPRCTLRKALVAAFVDLGARSAAPLLRRAISTVQVEKVGPRLDDTALDLRAMAALALAQLDRENALPCVALLLHNFEPAAPVPSSEWAFAKARGRIAAARAIAAVGDMAGAALLVVKLTYPEGEVPEVLAECLRAAAELRPPNLLDVVEPYMCGRDAWLAATTATALAEHLGEDAIPALVEHLDHMPKEARLPAVLAITGIRSAATGPALAGLFTHSDPAVRAAAIEGAALYPTPEIRVRIREKGEHEPDPAVRAAAAAALSRMPNSG